MIGSRAVREVGVRPVAAEGQAERRADHLQAEPGEPAGPALVGQRHRGAAVGQHERRAVRRRLRVEREVGAAGLEHREEGAMRSGERSMYRPTTESGPTPTARR